MSELRSAIEGFRSEELGSMPDARAEEDFAELFQVRERLEAEILRRLADLDRRGAYRRDGHLSTVSWLVAAFNVAGGAAKDLVRSALALEEMPATRESLEAGEVSTSALRVLVGAREADSAAFEGAEQTLLQAAQAHSVRDLGRVTAYWRQAVQAEQSVSGEERMRERRRLHVSPLAFGMVRIDGELDAENGEALLTALEAEVGAQVRSGLPDERTAAQRRADALGEICRRRLDEPARPTIAGERPHLTVTMDLATLQRARHGTCELGHAGPVAPELARRLACEAGVIPAVLGSRSEPLDLGRRTPVVSPSLRRAVVLRDRRCRFPGCDRDPSWCDAHHVRHWADGGATALQNLVLLCRRHHRLVHEGGFGLAMAEGGPVFRRPDGSTLAGRAPP